METTNGQRTGTLYLIPVPLGNVPVEACLPAEAIAVTRRLTRFVVENAKTARAMLKLFGHPGPIRDVEMSELNEHTSSGIVPNFLQALRDGHDLGLISDAGCPAVADPGSQLVELAHRENIPVRPMSGSSSIVLALMGSGMNGQRFTFHGYLPTREQDRADALRRLEASSKQTRGVEIFIETPYRNGAMLAAALQLKPDTRLCVACDLTLPSEWIRSASIAHWKRHAHTESIDRRPCVFLIQAA